MRFNCVAEGLEANWIEYSDVWTRDEGAELLKCTNQQAIDVYLPTKCIACHIEQIDGPAVTDPKKITWDWLGGIDVRLHQFVIRALIICYTEQLQLGNASARPLFAIAEAKVTAPTNQLH